MALGFGKTEAAAFIRKYLLSIALEYSKLMSLSGEGSWEISDLN